MLALGNTSTNIILTSAWIRPLMSSTILRRPGLLVPLHIISMALTQSEAYMIASLPESMFRSRKSSSSCRRRACEHTGRTPG